MLKILIVCLGNICRSPLAEGIMRQKIEQYKLSAKVDSAGTINNHVGENPDKRSIANAKKHGVDISGLVARQFTVSDYDAFDIIFVMDESNYIDVIALARNAKDKKKVRFILNEIYPQLNKPLPDPYFGGEEGFELVHSLLDEACESISHKIERKILPI